MPGSTTLGKAVKGDPGSRIVRNAVLGAEVERLHRLAFGLEERRLAALLVEMLQARAVEAPFGAPLADERSVVDAAELLVELAQGSGTVAILTGAAIMAPLVEGAAVHPVWMMMAVGTGGMLFAWYNDSGYWIVKEVSGITQAETFKTFSAVNFVMSITGITAVPILSTLFPLT